MLLPFCPIVKIEESRVMAVTRKTSPSISKSRWTHRCWHFPYFCTLITIISLLKCQIRIPDSYLGKSLQNFDDKVSQFYRMESKIITSRSVVVNHIFKKEVEQNYEKHMQRLQEIRNRKFSRQGGEPSELLARKLSVKHSTAKVQEEFDPHLNEKKSLISHIRTILTRKGESFKEIKRYKNKFLENEKKEIERQNKLLYEKIGEGQQNRLTKKQLKQQFADYESHKSLLRKVKYESQKPQKQRRKSVDAAHEMKHPD